MMEKQLENRTEKVEKRLQRYLKGAVIFVVIVWCATFLSNCFVFNNINIDGGTLGDSFGMVNALFSGLAFAFLIYTSFIQKEELRLQRKELEENREELRRSADAHRELVELTKEQIELTRNINKDNLSPRMQFEFIKMIAPHKYLVQLIVKNGQISVAEIKSSTFQILNGEELKKENFKNGQAMNLEIYREKPINGAKTIKIFYEYGFDTYSQRVTIDKGRVGRISGPALENQGIL